MRITADDMMNADTLLKNGAILTYNLHNGVTDFKQQIYNCLINKPQFQITSETDDNVIIGTHADYLLGLATDYAVQLKKCESGLDYSVYF